ncbi:MAG: hypothetical protein OIF47_13920 [Marinibacterium sp.]|nr:hypothetical protein [Marinibacterium sp.]
MTQFDRILATAFWFVFGASVALHFWIGDVVVDRNIDGAQFYLLLRGDRAHWMQVSYATYYASFGVRYASILLGIVIVAAAVWRCIAHRTSKDS